MFSYRIVNMIITARPKQKITIYPKEVARIFANIEYDKGGPLRIMVRLRDKKYKVWLTRESNIIIPGVTSLKEARQLVKKIYRCLFNNNLEFNLEIKNLVMAVNIGKQLEVNEEKGLHYYKRLNAWVYRRSGKTYLIFKTGKVIITGLRGISEINQVIDVLQTLLS